MVHAMSRSWSNSLMLTVTSYLRAESLELSITDELALLRRRSVRVLQQCHDANRSRALNDFPLGKYDVTVKHQRVRPGRLIAWTILGQIKRKSALVYGYRLKTRRGSTLVTSFYDWSESISTGATPASFR